MILINFINIPSVFPGTYETLIHSFPSDIQELVNSYQQDQDKKRCFYGRLLLKKMLMEQGFPHTVLNDLKRDAKGRPYIHDEIDFNISHSSDYVLCAVSRQSRVGIDINKMEDLDLNDIMNEVLNSREIQKINMSPTPHKDFYEIWTIKEAALKADGAGLSKAMTELQIHENTVLVGDERWYFSKLTICKQYLAHVAYKQTQAISICDVSSLDFIQATRPY